MGKRWGAMMPARKGSSKFNTIITTCTQGNTQDTASRGPTRARQGCRRSVCEALPACCLLGAAQVTISSLGLWPGLQDQAVS